MAPTVSPVTFAVEATRSGDLIVADQAILDRFLHHAEIINVTGHGRQLPQASRRVKRGQSAHRVQGDQEEFMCHERKSHK